MCQVSKISKQRVHNRWNVPKYVISDTVKVLKCQSMTKHRVRNYAKGTLKCTKFQSIEFIIVWNVPKYVLIALSKRGHTLKWYKVLKFQSYAL